MRLLHEATGDKSQQNNCSPVVCAVKDCEDGEWEFNIQFSNLCPKAEIVPPRPTTWTTKVSPYRRAIEFQYAEVVKQWKASTGLMLDCLSSFYCSRVKRTGKTVIKELLEFREWVDRRIRRINRLATDPEKEWGGTWSPILY